MFCSFPQSLEGQSSFLIPLYGFLRKRHVLALHAPPKRFAATYRLKMSSLLQVTFFSRSRYHDSRCLCSFKRPTLAILSYPWYLQVMMSSVNGAYCSSIVYAKYFYVLPLSNFDRSNMSSIPLSDIALSVQQSIPCSRLHIPNHDL
jgi:hypothetical protein